MSDKLSSPSASSGNNSVVSPRGSNNSNGDEYHLVVQRQPPKYVYSNESFVAELQLQEPKTISPPSIGEHDIELHASLHYVKTGLPCGNEAILITEPSRILLPAAGDGSARTCKVKCSIRTDGIRKEQGVALELRFSTRQDVASPPVRTIIGVATSSIHLVNYKIKLTMEEEWEKVWYKDEGGRDKSMEVYAAVYDKDGNLRTGEQIPLLPLLCYDGDERTPVRVSNQEIMRTLGSMKTSIDKDTGKARIRFRVEDVSKNHQGQDFVLEVGPDPKSKSFKDIAPAFTDAVNVRSKRNKRSRSNSAANRLTERRSSGSPVPGRQRYDDGREISFQSGELPQLQDALKGVMGWADEVVNGLYPLQWQVIGYQQHPDGSPDYARPYHNMPNPNPCISRILSTYSESVRDHLRTLLTAIEESNPARMDEPNFMPLAASIPRESDDPYGMMRSPPIHGHGAMHPQSAGRRHGMHNPMGPDVYRDKPPEPPVAMQGRAHLPQMHQPMPGMMPGHPYMRPRPEEAEMMMHGHPPPHRRAMMQHPGPPEMPMQRTMRAEEDSRESEVEYVLAKQYKALRTGERLGFPAYSANKEILGFYRESQGKVGVGQFSPISHHRKDFGPLEIMQATEILEDAIIKKSDAVHALKDWGSIGNLLDHALVYEWSKDIGNDASDPTGRP